MPRKKQAGSKKKKPTGPTKKKSATTRPPVPSLPAKRAAVASTKKERRPVARKQVSSVSSIDIDRVVREEVTEWFTSNRKGLEQVFRRVADQVRDDMDAAFQERLDEEREKAQIEIRKLAEENAGLRERVRGMEEEHKRMRSILSMVRNQVSDDAAVD